MPSEEPSAGVTQADPESPLIQLLDWVERKKDERQQGFTESEDVTLREQAHGAYVELSNMSERLRDHIVASAPACDRCGTRKDLRRDKRLKSGFRWDCRHCDQEGSA